MEHKHYRVIVLSNLDSSTRAVITALMGISRIEVTHYSDPVEAMNDTADIRKYQTLLGAVAIGEITKHPLLEAMVIQLEPGADLEPFEISSETIDAKVLNEISEIFAKMRDLQY